jgi:hypothetical protein
MPKAPAPVIHSQQPTDSVARVAVEADVMPDLYLATEFHDGDPTAAWAVGMVVVKHYAEDGYYLLSGDQTRYRKAQRIDASAADWLMSAAAVLRQAPPGTVTLWGMMRKQAFPDWA